ncbi:MAG: transcription antitermination factor NusB [Pseudomonadota bacterium]
MNEYIKISAEFMDDKEVKFINGILNNIAKDN